jgi:hypothetical protein
MVTVCLECRYHGYVFNSSIKTQITVYFALPRERALHVQDFYSLADLSSLHSLLLNCIENTDSSGSFIVTDVGEPLRSDGLFVYGTVSTQRAMFK